MKCLECKKELEQTPGKRSKTFCNSTCRSNFWQKEARKKKGAKPKVTIKNLNENTSTVTNKTKPAPKTNFTVNTTKTENNGLNRPVRLEGEGAIDFAGRLNEWKKSQQ